MVSIDDFVVLDARKAELCDYDTDGDRGKYDADATF
jgi:hypothetical protein